MQRICRFEIISVSREENSLSCSTEWDKSVYFTPSNLLPKSVVKMKHLTREQRNGISLMLQEGKSRKDIAKQQEIAEKLEISFYFCKPYHSWERGANENTNGLIRQYIPKGTDFSGITDEFVSWVENKLNNRPRKRLGYLTPNEKFNSILTNQNSIAFAS